MHRSFLCAVAVGCWQQTGVSGSFCPATVIVLIADDCFVYAVDIDVFCSMTYCFLVV